MIVASATCAIHITLYILTFQLSNNNIVIKTNWVITHEHIRTSFADSSAIHISANCWALLPSNKTNKYKHADIMTNSALWFFQLNFNSTQPLMLFHNHSLVYLFKYKLKLKKKEQ
jgi:hypothetical protein